MPCPNPSHALPIVRVGWDRSPAAARGSRAWVRRLPIVGKPAAHTHAWLRYLSSVYGMDMIDRLLPFDVRALTWFYWWAPGTENLTRTEVPVWRDTLPGEAWVPGLRSERHLAHAGFFVRPLPLVNSSSNHFAGFHVLEVMRVSHPAGETLQSAYGPEAASHDQVWYWHAPGSGIFLAAGRTLTVSNRSALVAELAVRLAPEPLPLEVKVVKVPHDRGMRLCDGCTDVGEDWRDFHVLWWTSGEKQKPMCRVCDLARRAGIDTIQLTRAFGGLRSEIIDCRQNARAGMVTGTPFNSGCPPAASRAHIRSAAMLLQDGPKHEGCLCTADFSSRTTFLNCGSCSRSVNFTLIRPMRRSKARAEKV